MLQQKIKYLPEKPGVYMFKTKSGKILYIGKTKNLKKRVSQYFQKDIGFWKEEMLSRADKIDFIITKSEEESFLLENNLIKKYQPPFNSLLKGDTGYIYIRIGRSSSCDNCKDFPKIEFTRYKDKPGIYIGPKPWKKNLKKLLQILRQILKFRSCSDIQFKKGNVCSDYIFGLCKGRCIKQNQTDENKKEYKKIITYITEFFKGNYEPIKNIILDQLNKAIKKRNFERAAKLKDIYFFIDKIIEGQNVILDENLNGYYFLIKKIGKFTIFIITYFYEGKLIDIIKYKEKNLSLEDAIENIKRELGTDIFLEKLSNTSIFGYKGNIIDHNNNILEFLMNQIDTIIISSNFEKENILNDILKNIQKKLKLKNLPYKIEGLDISHLSGGRTGGGLVKMTEGIMYKKGYRKYKIKSLKKKGDDLSSLKAVLIRRFKLKKNISIEKLDLPDLFIIDGGESQIKILNDLKGKYTKFSKILEKVDFISISKGKSKTRKGKLEGFEEQIFVLDKNGNIKNYSSKTLSEEELKILTKVRDESHRFANKYREQQMKKEFQN